MEVSGQLHALVHAKFLTENLKGRNEAEDLGVDGKIILVSEWILGK
jgi:hypothetical protein